MNTPGPEETIAVGRGPLVGRRQELALLDQRFAEAGDALTEARAAAETSGEGFRSVEIHRLHGELMLAQGGERANQDAEQALLGAPETARGQRAKSLELRAAVSLGRLWQTLGRAGEARQLVSEVHGGSARETCP